ncbi:hypothetical protein, partial [Pseudomonas aeruginosa]|uniref:hypothetical protein n=1 Tax=Pseudomonas aeruginosa TaxID=287 RepID=UPI0031B6AD71
EALPATIASIRPESAKPNFLDIKILESYSMSLTTIGPFQAGIPDRGKEISLLMMNVKIY